MTFNDANTVEQMILDACQGLGWQFVPRPQLPRHAADVFVPREADGASRGPLGINVESEWQRPIRHARR